MEWNLNITQLKGENIFQTSIFGFHVDFQGVKSLLHLKNVQLHKQRNDFRESPGQSQYIHPRNILNNLDLLKMLAKSNKYSPKWWLMGGLGWEKFPVKHHPEINSR